MASHSKQICFFSEDLKLFSETPFQKRKNYCSCNLDISASLWEELKGISASPK